MLSSWLPFSRRGGAAMMTCAEYVAARMYSLEILGARKIVLT